MKLEDTNHNLKIVGKIFIVLGILIIPISIVSFSSIYFLTDSDWWFFDDFIDFGALHFRIPFEMLYVIPSFHLGGALLLIVSGFGLLKDKNWAKAVSLFPAVILLFFFPIGTALGIFLIYLLHQKSQMEEASIETTE